MTQNEIQSLLDSGSRLGVTKSVDSPDYLGWILVGKHPANLRRLAILEESGELSQTAEVERARIGASYLVLNIELKRSVHEAGEYETEDDYRMKTATWCKDLTHVQDVLRKLGVELGQLQFAREIDAP